MNKFIMTILFFGTIVHAEFSYEQEAKLYADFLVTGRSEVAKALKEYKINDASLSEKGFHSDKFILNINSSFFSKHQIDILKESSDTNTPKHIMKNLKLLLVASKNVLDSAHAMIDMPGIIFKGFIPATYGKAVGDIFRQKTGITLKQTSDKFRNIYNKPDKFELNGLIQLKNGDIPKGKTLSIHSKKSFRLLYPIYIEKACLVCHGSPKGEKDVAGRLKEGYKEGDLRGAISVSIPIKK